MLNAGTLTSTNGARESARKGAYKHEHVLCADGHVLGQAQLPRPRTRVGMCQKFHRPLGEHFP